jgi:hypothetical protein
VRGLGESHADGSNFKEKTLNSRRSRMRDQVLWTAISTKPANEDKAHNVPEGLRCV